MMRPIGFESTVTIASGLSWNPSDKNTTTLSNSNTTATGSGGNNWVRGLTGKSAGKYYFAVSIDTLPSTTEMRIGVATSTATLTTVPSTGCFVMEAYGGTGGLDGYYLPNGNPTNTTNLRFEPGDVFGVAVDFGTGSLFFQKNGSWCIPDFSGTQQDPTTNSSAFGTLSGGTTYYPLFWTGSSSNQVTLVTGTPPSGFSAWP